MASLASVPASAYHMPTVELMAPVTQMPFTSSVVLPSVIPTMTTPIASDMSLLPQYALADATAARSVGTIPCNSYQVFSSQVGVPPTLGPSVGGTGYAREENGVRWAGSHPGIFEATEQLAYQPMLEYDERPHVFSSVRKEIMVPPIGQLQYIQKEEPSTFPLHLYSPRQPLACSVTNEQDTGLWIGVGTPAARLEPTWIDGAWYLVAPVDFKGLDGLPRERQNQILTNVDEALRQVDQDGQIPPLPPPRHCQEDTCPIA